MPKINRKLTETEIKNAKPKDKAYKLYDEGGLRLLVRPSGSKVWQYPYKYSGKSNIYTIGTYGTKANEITSAAARQIRDEVKQQLKEGLDPNQHKKTQFQKTVVSGSNTFESIARDWYSKQDWAPKHAKNILSRLEKDVFPLIGKIPIAEVGIPDILEILKRIESRGALDVAKRICQYCTAVFDYAILQGLCDSNPALGRGKFIKSAKRQNRPHLTEKELPAFVEALEAHPSMQMKLAIKLLLMTFVRPGELRNAKWQEVDFEAAIWHIPAERMKMSRDHLVPLSSQALEVLEELKAISGHRELILPGLRPIKPISDVALIKAVRKLSKDKCVPHGFRHTASTILHERGFNSDYVEMQLAHVEESKVRGTYNKAQYLEPRKEMMQWWSNYLYENMPSSSGANVVSLRK